MGWPKGKPRKPPEPPQLPRVFIPDTLIPRQVRWDGYGAIRPWVAQYAAKTYGCILRHCQVQYRAAEQGHWVSGPQREVGMAITRMQGIIQCLRCPSEAAVWWLHRAGGSRELEALPDGWALVGTAVQCPEHGGVAEDAELLPEPTAPLLGWIENADMQEGWPSPEVWTQR